MINNLNMDYEQKMQRYHEYIEALEEERKKIQVFERELPLCLELVTQAIETCKKELSGTTTEQVNGQSECSEQTMSESGPVFEEFIPIKRSSSCDEDDEHESHKPENNKSDEISKENGNNNIDKRKSDWLRSVQLWNQSSDPPLRDDHAPRKVTVVEVKRTGGAFQPFQKEKTATKSNDNCSQHSGEASRKAGGSVPAASSSTADTSGGKQESMKKAGQQETQRKQRRCWSPELHRRFLHALQQLGGPHVATPKQIKELMKVDGLTNDEVKSHLQKYRLHTRRPNPTVHNNGNPQQPQIVVVGGIWVPPPPPSSANAAAGIYAPVAAPPEPPHLSQTQERSESGSEDRSGRCNSPAISSSSTHTARASPVSS